MSKNAFFLHFSVFFQLCRRLTRMICLTWRLLMPERCILVNSDLNYNNNYFFEYHQFSIFNDAKQDSVWDKPLFGWKISEDAPIRCILFDCWNEHTEILLEYERRKKYPATKCEEHITMTSERRSFVPWRERRKDHWFNSMLRLNELSYENELSLIWKTIAKAFRWD